MKTKIKKGSLITLLLLTLTLAACQNATPTVDAAVKITEIASTMHAQMTLDVQLTPSVTPSPTITPTATEAPPTATVQVLDVTSTPTTRPTQPAATDDNAAWAGDVTIPDGTIVKPGSSFVKTWAIRNTGKTTWSKDFRLMYIDGVMDANQALYANLQQEVKPGETVNVSVTFIAPIELGTYYSYWRMVTNKGVLFGEQMSLKIVSGNP